MRRKRQFKTGRCYRLVSRVAHRVFFFDAEEVTHAVCVVPIDQPERWVVQLERGSNAVAAKLLTFLESGAKIAAEIAEALETREGSVAIS